MKKQLLKLSAIAAGLFLFAGIVSAQHTKPLQAALVIPSLDVVGGTAYETMTIDGADNEASYGAENTVAWCWTPASGVIAARDLGGFFKVCYDKTNLYLYCKVTDDTAGIYDGAGNQWTFDNVELFLDMDSTINLVSNLGSYNQGTHADTTTDANQYRWDRQIADSSLGNAGRNGTDLNNFGLTDPGQYWTVEVAVPWMATMPTGATIQSLNDWFAQTIGFDISYADNDSGTNGDRVGQIAWEGDTNASGGKGESDQAWHDTRDFGFASFEAITPLTPVNAIKTIDKTSINMYPVPATSVLNISNLEGANSIDFVNSLGQSVKTISSINASTVAVNVSDLTSGVYMVRINMNNGDVVTGKMVR
jgi:hypothetical protein